MRKERSTGIQGAGAAAGRTVGEEERRGRSRISGPRDIETAGLGSTSGRGRIGVAPGTAAVAAAGIDYTLFTDCQYSRDSKDGMISTHGQEEGLVEDIL